MQALFADYSASISELKKSPTALLIVERRKDIVNTVALSLDDL